MTISRLQFRLASELSDSKTTFKIIIDGREYITACFLIDDILNLLHRYTELAEEGRKLDLFFSNASPFSMSISYRGGTHYLRLSDNFDGGILEDRVSFIALKSAISDFISEVLDHFGRNQFMREELRSGLQQFNDWPGPAPVS